MIDVQLLAFIPSPSSGAISLGPLTIHAYGICIALGVVVAVVYGGRRWVARGGSPEDLPAIATWAVPAGIIGARIYHVITDNELYREKPWEALYIWDGGLGIWGGIAAGVAVGLWAGRRRGLPVRPLLDMVAPPLLIAQAIGRVGNWFNQELFGRPTTLPWGLEIDPANRPSQYSEFATFHPTFLYEALWMLVLAAFLVWLDRKRVVRPGRIFVLYVAGYTFVRFFLENLRIDPANVILGMRVNAWASVIVFLACVFLLLKDRLSPPGPHSHEHRPAEEPAADQAPSSAP